MDAVRRGLARVHANLVDGLTALTCISHKAPARLLPLHTPAAAGGDGDRARARAEG